MSFKRKPSRIQISRERIANTNTKILFTWKIISAENWKHNIYNYFRRTKIPLTCITCRYIYIVPAMIRPGFCFAFIAEFRGKKEKIRRLLITILIRYIIICLWFMHRTNYKTWDPSKRVRVRCILLLHGS